MKVFINLDLKKTSYRNDSNSHNPKWFSFPILKSNPKIVLSDNFSLSDFFNFRNYNIIAFNPSISYFFLFKFFYFKNKISLYQWKKIESLSIYKSFALKTILKKSDKILVYSLEAKNYLNKLFPGKNITYINLYTDTEFYNLEKKSISNFDFNYIFIPGDHLRDENNLISILNHFKNHKIIRVTRNKKVFDNLKNLNHSRLIVKFNVSFKELRELYFHTDLTLILSNSNEIPTGITTLCEAISCGSKVLITKGHSNIDTFEFNTNDIYDTIKTNYSKQDLLISILNSLNKKNNIEIKEKFAKKYLGISCNKNSWKSILQND